MALTIIRVKRKGTCTKHSIAMRHSAIPVQVHSDVQTYAGSNTDCNARTTAAPLGKRAGVCRCSGCDQSYFDSRTRSGNFSRFMEASKQSPKSM